MQSVRKRLDNQAIGLLPLLLFMFLDNFFPYMFSFVIGVIFFLFCIIIFHILRKDLVYQFMLLPSAGTLILYTFLILLKLDPMLYRYSPIVTALLLVATLAIIGFTRQSVMRFIHNSKLPAYKRTMIRSSLYEFYFLAHLTQGLYTLHLFLILLYSILPETMQSASVERFLYRYMGLFVGLGIIIFEHIRLQLMQGSLRKELWLPVLNEKGKVIGCIARSVSRALPKKYYHPVVRVAVIFNGMLYLVKRSTAEFVSSNTMDYPLHGYVLFRDTIAASLKDMIGDWSKDASVHPRFLIRYTFENDKVKHLVSLFVLPLQSEQQLEQFKQKSGKLWTTKQIEDNLNTGVFSEYFEKEFPYLQKTILLAERISCEH